MRLALFFCVSSKLLTDTSVYAVVRLVAFFAAARPRWRFNAAPLRRMSLVCGANGAGCVMSPIVPASTPRDSKRLAWHIVLLLMTVLRNYDPAIQRVAIDSSLGRRLHCRRFTTTAWQLLKAQC